MILLASAVFPPEPVVSASLSYDLAQALSENSVVHVITPKPTRPLGFSFMEVSAVNTSFHHIVVESYTCPTSEIFGRMRESYSFGKHVSKYIGIHHDEINCLYINAWPLLAQFLIVRTARKYGIPTVIHVQDLYPESLSNKIWGLGKLINLMLLPIDRYILKNATKIAAISDKMASDLVRTRDIAADKIVVVNNWQNETEFITYSRLLNGQNAIDQQKRPFTFMYLGNIGPVAGVEFLIESFIKANLENALLVVAGSGSKKDACIRITATNKSTNVIFQDVPAGKVPENQDQADILLLPVKQGASSSSIPSKLPAYMFSKKAIIACVEENSDTAIAIRKANCGWVVPPEDIQTLAETMKAATFVPNAKLLAFGINGFKYALENYSKENNLPILVNLVINASKG